VVAVVVLLVLVLPGFITNELATSRRATHPARSDLETVLRALWYSVVIHVGLAATGWTLDVVKKVDQHHEFERHIPAICLLVAVAVFALPAALGSLLGARLRYAEQRGNLRWFDHVAGGRDARRAWDYVFGHTAAGYVVVHLKDFPPEGLPTATPAGDGQGGGGSLASWSTIVGEISDKSGAAQTPSDGQDLWLPEVWPGDATGRIIGQFDPPRSMWLAADNIVAMHVLAETADGGYGTRGRTAGKASWQGPRDLLKGGWHLVRRRLHSAKR
jgi:hypothetical protein